MDSSSIGFIGLGTMGLPMAGHLARTGAPLLVWNRTAGKTDGLQNMGAKIADSLFALAQRCSTVILCVNRTEDVQEVLSQVAPAARTGMLFIDHSTISPVAAREIGRDLTTQGLRFVDAPITGGSMGAQNGTLTVFLGGAEVDCTEAAELVRPYAKRAERVGGPGAGQMAKMANQIAVAGALLGLCESLAFAEKAGLDVGQTKDLVGGGAGGSWAFENYGPKILAGDWSPGFSVKNQRKDFRYCLEAGKELDACLAATSLADRLLAELEKEGRGEQATAALFDVYRRSGENCA